MALTAPVLVPLVAVVKSAVSNQQVAATILEALGIAPGDDVGGLRARHQNGLGFQLLGDAKPVDDLREIDAACPAFGGIGVHDGFGGEQRTL